MGSDDGGIKVLVNGILSVSQYQAHGAAGGIGVRDSTRLQDMPFDSLPLRQKGSPTKDTKAVTSWVVWNES